MKPPLSLSDNGFHFITAVVVDVLTAIVMVGAVFGTISKKMIIYIIIIKTMIIYIAQL